MLQRQKLHEKCHFHWSMQVLNAENYVPLLFFFGPSYPQKGYQTPCEVDLDMQMSPLNAAPWEGAAV